DARWDSVDGNNRATCNFWRGVENLYIGSNTKWAVSQATFMRRVAVDGALYLHDEYGWASGGFLANSHVKLMIDGGSQQQWLSRNNQFKMWNDDNWNLVFSGDTPGCDPEATWPAKAYTSVESTKSMREKPYLAYEEETFYVHVPKLREESQGPDWTMDFEMGQAAQTGEEDRIPLDAFYIAKPEDTADLLNEQLNDGKHIFFTPGIYKLDKALEVREGSILLGTGLASLVPTEGNACIVTDDNPGNTIAGLLFDAGEVESELLVDFGGLVEEETEEEKKQGVDAGSDKPLLADVFFRVGGTPTVNPTKVKSCLKISTNNTLGDNFWIWRADHGDQVAWNRNTADHGLVVDGDNVQIYALMVEHFQKEQTIWNGDNGYILMYQSELPYDVPNQSEWVRTDIGRNGYPSIYVKDDVSSFEGVGIGIYSFHRDAAVEEYNVMEVPDKDGVKVHHICAIMITGNPGISHVLNDVGAPAMTGGAKSIIIDYENGVWK
ncbi:MAG: sialidase, partial [Lachnospiraceae bacterium]|nr:sialidase [Lachnospiraceae bacterium]